jgi:tripartite-type tricarboxylate transporter receptor subunit TctC
MARRYFQFLCTLFFVGFAWAVAANITWAAEEESYPSKPIKLIIGGGPGQSIDITMRSLAKAAEKILGQPIVCTNVEGAGGNRALSTLVNEKPDGYTLVTLTTGAVTTGVAEKVKIDPAKDFTPVMNAQDHPVPVAVKKDSPWNAWPDFIKTAREQQGSVKIGNSGPKGRDWLVMNQIAKKENVKFLFVPFSAAGDCITALLGGHINVTTHVSAVAYCKSGELKSLLFFADQRLKGFPNVPTATEVYGDMPGFRGSIAGILAPKGMPEKTLAKLHDAFRKALEDEEYRKLLDRFDILVSHRGPEDFRNFIVKIQTVAKEGLEQFAK